jgi:hypothetical protein
LFGCSVDRILEVLPYQKLPVQSRTKAVVEHIVSFSWEGEENQVKMAQKPLSISKTEMKVFGQFTVAVAQTHFYLKHLFGHHWICVHVLMENYQRIKMQLKDIVCFTSPLFLCTCCGSADVVLVSGTDQQWYSHTTSVYVLI